MAQEPLVFRTEWQQGDLMAGVTEDSQQPTDILPIGRQDVLRGKLTEDDQRQAGGGIRAAVGVKRAASVGPADSRL